MWIKWMIKEGIKEGTTSLPTKCNIAEWVDKAMVQMKEEQRIIKNVWLKSGFVWFDKEEGEGVLGGWKGWRALFKYTN
jgi:hypothetical protein